jgi:cephalosporin hydroxylase
MSAQQLFPIVLIIVAVYFVYVIISLRKPENFQRCAFGVIMALAVLCAYQYFAFPTTNQQVIDRFHTLFYHDDRTVTENKWLGVVCSQNPNDAWIHQEIISEVKPDYIIETGTHKGGSAVLWASILQCVNPEGKIISIDIKDWGVDAAKAYPFVQKLVEFVVASSTDEKSAAAIAEKVKGKKVLVILDSDHHKFHVLGELKAFAPLVSVGSYIIVQDTNFSGHPVEKPLKEGPWEAVDEFLAANPNFEADRSRERFLFSFHPRGYLKRVR